MSSTVDTQRRSPMFYCHECHAEMRPLMMPDPHCASCHGTFVEEISDNTEDDPRNFTEEGDNDNPFVFPLEGRGDPVIQFMNALMAMTAARHQGREAPEGRAGSPTEGARTLRLDMRSGSGPRGFSFTMGGGGSREPEPNAPGELFTMLGGERTVHTAPLGAVGAIPLGGLLAAMFGGPGAIAGSVGSGQMGDYALNQQALDEIITQLMENGQGSRPVPAPDDLIASLRRSKVEPGSPLLQKDCAVCKDSFEVTNTPSVITLPCSPNPKYSHSFHDECILPWLKQSGTCPVCRHELVPQPHHHAPGSPQDRGGNGGDNPGGGSPDQSPRRRGSGSGSGGGLGGLWDLLTSRSSSSGSSNNQYQARGGAPNTSSLNGTDPRSSRQHRNGPSPSPIVPGSWDDLD